MTKKICLAMIVKNETEVIARCLKSVKPHIDYYVIADTGSTDKTIATIKRTMKGTKGTVLKRPWVDFGTNRTEVFKYIYENYQDVDYVLVLDADDILHVNNWANLDLDKDVYDIVIKTVGIEYYQRRLFSNKLNWSYVGVVHEFPTADEGIKSQAQLTPLALFIEHKGDGISWKNEIEKYREQSKIFETLPKPLSPRNQFYYAQSLLSAGRMQDAIQAYEERIKMGVGDWDQEIFYSKYLIAKTYHNLGELDKATIAYLDAYQFDPERIEPLYQLCRLSRISQKYALGYMFGLIATKTPMPPIGAKMFLEKWAWEADLFNEFGICAYYTGHKEVAKVHWKEALKFENISKEIKESVLANLKFVK